MLPSPNSNNIVLQVFEAASVNVTQTGAQPVVTSDVNDGVGNAFTVMF